MEISLENVPSRQSVQEYKQSSIQPTLWDLTWPGSSSIHASGKTCQGWYKTPSDQPSIIQENSDTRSFLWIRHLWKISLLMLKFCLPECTCKILLLHPPALFRLKFFHSMLGLYNLALTSFLAPFPTRLHGLYTTISSHTKLLIAP